MVFIRDYLKNTLGLTDLHEMPNGEKEATLDGGDVVFTGKPWQKSKLSVCFLTIVV